MDLRRYFARTGYTGPESPTLPVLRGLLRAHVLSIPFEALDVQLGKPVSLEAEAAYEKIVVCNRGGWCYEQNGLFGRVLDTIGFDVMRVAAAARRSERGAVADANHLCLLVRTVDSPNTWLVDVGFGGSMIAPIRLQEGEYEQRPFHIGLRRTEDSYWRFWEDPGDGAFDFDFRAEAADESALRAKCEFLQTSPDSGFVQNLVVQIRLPSAHRTLRGKVLSQAGAGGTGTRIIDSPDELVAVLRDVFHLDVPEVAGLWSQIERRHRELFQNKPAGDRV
jgi:N-hydroxyarylamine O-acetyltransferase